MKKVKGPWIILSGDLPHEAIAAFLIGFRLKPETVTEYRGCLASVFEKTPKKEIQNSIELGFPFDGKNRFPYLFPLTAKFLQPFEINFVLVGDERVPSKEGVTVKEMVNSISLPENIFYFDRQNFLPSLSSLTTLRNHLGLRTALNTLEKASGVGSSQHAAIGVFHKPYIEKYSEIFKDKFKSILIVQANEGSPEVIKKCKVFKSSQSKLEEELIDPSFFGVDVSKYEFENISVQESLDIYKDPSSDIVKLAKMNAALMLWLKSNDLSLKKCLENVDM